MAGIRHRTLPELAGMRRDVLTGAFLNLYATDDEFAGGLRAVAEEHAGAWSVSRAMGWHELDSEATYGETKPTKSLAFNIEALVRKWNLDRLPDHIGYDAVTREIFRQMRNPSNRVILLHAGMHFVPHVDGEDITSDEWPRPLGFRFDGRWHPGRETPGDAIKRLEGEFAAFIRAEIQAGVTRLSDAGYEYDDSTSTPTYLEWLYRRVARRESVAEIADSTNGGATYLTVETMTKRLARSLAIKRIPDDRTSRRGKR